MLPSIPELQATLTMPGRSAVPHAALIERVLHEALLPAATAVYTTLLPQMARAAAHIADARRAAGRPLRALEGLPVSVKDLYDIAGRTTLA